MPEKHNENSELTLEDDLRIFMWEKMDMPRIKDKIYSLVEELKKIKDRPMFYKTCEIDPDLSLALESLISTIERDQRKQKGVITIEKPYASAFKEYSDKARARNTAAVRAMEAGDLGTLALLNAEYCGVPINPESDKKRKEHQRLIRIKAALIALHVLNETKNNKTV